MDFYTDPFFWALLAMTGLAGATSLFSLHSLRRNLVFVATVLILVTAGRVILVLPFCPQPRFDLAGLHRVIGGIIFLSGLAAGAVPLFIIKWWSPPREGMRLRTTGIYGFVRHPIYLSEMLWCLGWAVMFRSVYGVALTPLWWAAFLIHTLAEEAALEKTLGEEYRDYKKKVRGRIFPGVPF